MRPLYHNGYSFRPTHKLWLAFNHKPAIDDDSPAMWRRIRLIPFLQKFEGTQNDRSLLDKLRAEGAGILNWAIEGCLAWQLEGLEPPAAVQQATKGYREESDVLMPFLDDCCLIDSGAFIESSKLWIAYMKWTERNGERSLARNTFADHLEAPWFNIR